VIAVIEILTHWYAGRSQNDLATSLGGDRKTLRKYTAPAVAAGIAPGGPPMDEVDWGLAAAGDRVASRMTLSIFFVRVIDLPLWSTLTLESDAF
jgi:hypothetical protein